MGSPETGAPVGGIALEFPASDGVLSCSPLTMPRWLRKRLSEPKTPPPATVEEIEAKLHEADLRRQKFYEKLSSKARQKPRNQSRIPSDEDYHGQRLEAKLLAAEEKRLSILTNAQMRLAKLDELRQAAKAQAEMRYAKERAELGTKVEMRVRKAEANRLLFLRAYRQRSATLRERASQSLLRRTARENKYKECVRAAIYQKRANAEKKRLGLLEAEKKRARARVLQVQKVASSISHQREIVRNEKMNNLEDRLQRARRKRTEYLKQKGRPYDAVYGISETLHEQADILARNLARCWREFSEQKKTTTYLVKAFRELYINERSVKSMPFEQFALIIQSTATLHKTKALLDRVELRHKLSRCIPNQPDWDSIDHLLKRVATPKRKESPRKGISRGGERTSSPRPSTKTPAHLSRYQVRVVLCAYMILGHPDAVISGKGERELALVKCAEKFVKEFELLIKVLLNGPIQISDEGTEGVLLAHRTFRFQLVAFDSAWCSYLNSFVVWKTKDASLLEEDLVRTACHLERSMIRTCKMTTEGDSGPLSHDMKAIQKQVTEDQKLLRKTLLHLSGDAGIERMENALYDTRSIFFGAKDNGGPTSLFPSSCSSSVDNSDKAHSLNEDSLEQSNVVRTLFKDDARSSVSSHSDSQVSQDYLEMDNVRIVNEYIHGEHLALVDGSSFGGEYYSHIMAKVKHTMEQAFWDGIIESVRQKEPNYSRVVELMKEVRDGICSVAPHSWRPEIIQAIDLDVFIQVLNSGKLDMAYLGKILEYSLITLRKLSAPAHEDQLNKKHLQFMKNLAETCAGDSSQNPQVVALIKGLRFVLEQIQELKQEISKARIRILEPFLKGPDALCFLGKAFTNHFGHPSNSLTTLPLTAKWLSYAQEDKDGEWNEHKSSLSLLAGRNENPSSFLPSTTLRTGGSSLVIMSENQANKSPTNVMEAIDPRPECKGEEIDLLVRLGLLKLVSRIAGLMESELPETMYLNFFRLRSMQSQVQKLIVISTSLLVLRQTLLSQQMISSQSQIDNILSGCVKRLLWCLDSVADAGIQDIVEILSTTIMEESESVDAKLQPVKEIMARMLSKSLQEEDAVFTRVSRAIYVAMRGVVLGGTGEQGRQLAEIALQKVGAPLLLDEVVQAASMLVTAAKVSVAVHSPWYAHLTCK